MKRTLLTLLLMLTLAVPVLANGDTVRPAKRTHTTQPRDASGRFVTTPATSLWSTLVESLTLSAGWRWQSEADAVTGAITAHDPFYLGAGVSVPLAQRVAAFANFDRDFTDAPLWQARTGLAFTPFSR